MNANKPAMELITEDERRQLVKNFHERIAGKIIDPMDFIPIVHAITADGKKSWMITKLGCVANI